MSVNKEEIEQNIQDSLEDENLDENIDGNIDENENIEDTFDIDEALDSTEPVDLAGKITDEMAKEKAIERGWREDGVDKYGHKISAIEFLERAPFFKKMDLMRHDIDRANNNLEKIKKQNLQIAKKSVEDKKKLIADFKAEKDKILSGEYIDEAGISDLKVLDEKIEAATEEAPLSEADQQIVSDYDEAKADFKNKNEWYDSNRAMTVLADKVGTEYAAEYLNKYGELPPPKETFDFTLKEVKKDFPDLGKPKRQTRVNSPSNRVTTQKIKNTKTLSDLPDDGSRDLAKEVMEATGQSEEEYLSTYNF